MSVKFKTGLQSLRHKTLLVISLMFMTVLLVSSLFAYKTLMIDNNSIRVKSAVELRNAVNKAETGRHVNIALTKDIALSTLVIPACADVTLKSASCKNGFFRLTGIAGVSVITVENGGRLTLGNIIVTHEGTHGAGVVVESGGVFVMVDGKISGNMDNGSGDGGGVVVRGGVFEFVGGVISDNVGGVSVSWEGSFSMLGGEIVGNTASGTMEHNGGMGGGVYNAGIFTMLGGVIVNNTAIGSGGGVYTKGVFEMYCGEISDNVAVWGGGVYVAATGSFIISGESVGGVVVNNRANDGGGVFIYYGDCSLFGGVISGNIAHQGGGVCNWYGTFNRVNSEISGNV
ncbi:MAG: hypothetical protein FWF62_01260, partial [Candidatus Bathyarchaeota archaeon]|nr:hypothetical protein [Candidatus Termiticorpusculum sp.]